MIVIADTSGLVAASDRNSPESGECRAVLGGAGTVIVSPLVLAEVDHVAKARLGAAARTTLISFILSQVRSGRFEVPRCDGGLLDDAQRVQESYAGLDLDLADGVNVALAAEYRTDAMLTLDRRDFRAVRPLTTHRAFRLLPDDVA